MYDKKRSSSKVVKAVWGTSSDDDSDNESIDVTALMAFEDSNSEIDQKDELDIPDLKNKLNLFSKTKLTSLMITLIDDLHDLT